MLAHSMQTRQTSLVLERDNSIVYSMYGDALIEECFKTFGNSLQSRFNFLFFLLI